MDSFIDDNVDDESNKLYMDEYDDEIHIIIHG